MTLSLDENNTNNQINAYQPGQLKIGDAIYTKSLILTPTHIIPDWPPQEFKEFTKENLDIILTLRPGIVLIGTGETLQFPPLSLYGHFINEKIGVEIMDTRAACHTYNALIAEDRNVVAALIIR